MPLAVTGERAYDPHSPARATQFDNPTLHIGIFHAGRF